MTHSFMYRPRSLRDQVVREVQTLDQVDKAPKVEPEILCTRCQHRRWSHCSIRRSTETREVLFYARSRGEYLWVRAHAYSAALSGYSLARCKHFRDDQPDFPLCDSSACACKGCDCTSFLSPYRKTRKKVATGKPRAKKASEQIELFAGHL